MIRSCWGHLQSIVQHRPAEEISLAHAALANFARPCRPLVLIRRNPVQTSYRSASGAACTAEQKAVSVHMSTTRGGSGTLLVLAPQSFAQGYLERRVAHAKDPGFLEKVGARGSRLGSLLIRPHACRHLCGLWHWRQA